MRKKLTEKPERRHLQRAWYRLITLAVTGGLAAAACGGDDSPETSPEPAVDPAEPAPPSTSTTTTTVVLDFGGGGDDGGDADGDGGDDPGSNAGGGDDDGHRPSISTPHLVIAPLDGQPVSDEGVVSRRALVVKIDNNDDRSRPQSGLHEADIVYEELIENSKTRFMAIFHSEIPERIGPVRSGRTSDIELLNDLGTPFLAYSGANAIVLGDLARAERAGVFVDIGGLSIELPYQRDRERKAPSNLYFDFSAVDTEAAASGAPAPSVQPLFDYGASNRAGLAGVVGISVRYSNGGRAVSHIWDPDVSGWVRIQDGTLHTAELEADLVELAPANLIVAQVDYDRSDADPVSPHVNSYGRGQGWVLSRGAVHDAAWERIEGRLGYRLIDSTGASINLAPGSTWVLLANSGRPYRRAEIELLRNLEAERMLADARANAALAAVAALASEESG